MENKMRLAIGIMGNGASLLLYAAPILTFKRVVKKRSTEEFSCVPYIIALLNCLLYTWYGLPIISNKLENLPLVSINGVGILLESSFIFIYIWFASAREKKKVIAVLLPVIMVFGITAFLSIYVLNSHHCRKTLVGSVGFVASVAMYGSPLIAMKQVIETKSVEFMPFYLSLSSFIASLLWTTYGLLSHDLLLTLPNLIGSPLGMIQLVMYCVYKTSTRIVKRTSHVDIEKNAEEGSHKTKE